MTRFTSVLALCLFHLSVATDAVDAHTRMGAGIDVAIAQFKQFIQELGSLVAEIERSIERQVERSRERSRGPRMKL
jgi:hypothetical protein